MLSALAEKCMVAYASFGLFKLKYISIPQSVIRLVKANRRRGDFMIYSLV